MALARKLTVIMLRMLKDDVPFNQAARATAGGLKEERTGFRAVPTFQNVLSPEDGSGQAAMRVVDASNNATILSVDFSRTL